MISGMTVTVSYGDLYRERRTRAAIYCRVSKDHKGQQRSVGEQETEGRRIVDREDWSLSGVWTDNDISASVFARKRVREEWEKLVDEVMAGKIDVIVVWEPSRLTRDMVVWASFVSICIEQHVKINASGKTYDPADPDDRFMLDLYFALAAREAATTRKRVNRSLRAAAADGRPHSRIPIGYRRVYDQRTGALVRQEPDPEMAPVVEWMYHQCSKGVPLGTIAKGLNAKGIPTPNGNVWRSTKVRAVLLNRAYIGDRVSKGEVTATGCWTALIDSETFWAVQRILTDPSRTTWRPGRAQHLLSALAVCGECGGKLTAGLKRAEGSYYFCYQGGHVGIKEDQLDVAVSALVVEYLSRPQIFDQLAAPDDRTLMTARAELERVEKELADLEKTVDDGEISVRLAAKLETSLRKDLLLAEEQLKAAGIPPILRAVIGPCAAEAWVALDIAAQREIIRMLADITVCKSTNPAGKGQPKGYFDPERVKVTWRDLPATAPATRAAGSVAA